MMDLYTCGGSDRYALETEDTCPTMLGCLCGDYDSLCPYIPEDQCCRVVYYFRGEVYFYWHPHTQETPVYVFPLKDSLGEDHA
jgi:hypothetical protein